MNEIGEQEPQKVLDALKTNTVASISRQRTLTIHLFSHLQVLTARELASNMIDEQRVQYIANALKTNTGPRNTLEPVGSRPDCSTWDNIDHNEIGECVDDAQGNIDAVLEKLENFVLSNS